MRLLRGLHNPGIRQVCVGKQCVATIGNFDGVHLGHQAIIQQVIDIAKARQLPSVVVIFEPQPLEHFKGGDAPARLARFREKYQALSCFDLDFVFCLRFDQALSKLSATEFVRRVLVSHLNVGHLVIGDDFRFGGDRMGDFSLLQQEGRVHDFTVENTLTILDQKCAENLNQKNTVSDPLAITNTRVSSTYVRSLLAAAKFEDVERVLGRPYMIMGRVIHGQKLGRQLGFPTANIALQRVNAPLNGVYVVNLQRYDGSVVEGVANIGVKPTVGTFLPSLEVHLFDFSEDLYGEQVQVSFCHKIRDEARFESIDALKAQIEEDICRAHAFFAQKSSAK